MKQEASDTRRLVTTSVLLALLALVSIVAATTAWMTIADRTRVRSMRMDITSGANLRFDLDARDSFEQYVRTLSFQQIAQRIQQEQGFSPADTPLTPVTTGDCVSFTLENGAAANTGDYWEFTLHFMATQDMVVHLTSADGSDGSGGTRIGSNIPALPQALRISFTAEQTSIYDPGMGNTTGQIPGGRGFGLPEGGAMTYHEGNALFTLKKDVDQPVVVRVWLEGTDEACTDDLRGADYSIQLRFVGTDENGNPLDDPRSGK